MHSSWFLGSGSAEQSMNLGHRAANTGSVEQSALTDSQSDLQAATGRGTSGEHSGNIEAHIRNRALCEHVASKMGSSSRIWK